MKKLLFTLMLLSSFALQAQNFTYNRFFNGGDNSAITLGELAKEVIVQPDGKVISCGYSYDFACNCFHIVMFRVDVCGNIDSTFGTNGTVSYTFEDRNTGLDFLMQANGKIVVVGTQAPSNASSQHNPYIARFLNNGQPDTTFGTMGTNKVIVNPACWEFTHVTEVADGKYLAQNGNYIMRFDSTGAVDLSFGNSGVINYTIPSNVPLVSSWRSVQRSSDKKIISVTAAWLGSGNDMRPLFMCTDTLGQLDSTFGTNGFLLDNNVILPNYQSCHIVLQNDDKILSAHHNAAETEITVARYNTNGSLDTTYGTNGYVNYTAPTSPFRARDVNILSNNNLLVMADAAGLDRQINTFDTNGVMTNSVTFFGNNNYNVSGSSVPLVLHVENDDEIYIVSQTGGTSGMWYISSLTTTPAPTISQNFTSLSANYNLTGTTYQWYLNGNIINGATDSTYTFTQNGVYSVTVTIASGCDYSYSYTVTNTGIANAANLNNIKVSPNPFNDYINISNTTGQLTTLTLFDAAGRTVILETTHEPDYKKQLQQLPKGMYFLTIESGSQSKHIKLLKH